MEESLNPGYEKNNITSSYHCKQIMVAAVFMNNSVEPGLFTSRGCCRCKASAHEAVVVHREWVATQQMR
jgi:hypothetical protein